MTATPYLDHRALNHFINMSKKAAPLKALPDSLLIRPAKVDRQVIDPLEPLTVAKVPNSAPASHKGHMMTPDGRLAVRVILQSEAEKFGVDGLTVREGAHMLLRLEQMADLEVAALGMQRDLVKATRALADLHAAALKGEKPSAKAMIAAAAVLQEFSG